ncbi:T9SS type B sorting domain-containing protein [Capnocytophaga felis]|nr:T9SS type B sorting domain-containing protein [Capnocytophaga felis]
MMRRIFLILAFFVVSQWAAGQCYDINSFKLTSSESVCLANGQVSVELPKASAGCTASLTVELKMPSGNTGGLKHNIALGQTVTFDDLAAGDYSVILHDLSGVSSNPKSINVAGTYSKMVINNLSLCGATMSRTSTTSPVFSQENGTIDFTIVGGTGIGTDFQVSLEDENGNILVPVRNVARPNASTNFTYTLTKESPTDRIPSGIKAFLVVKNIVPSNIRNCEEDIKKVEITMPPAVYMPGSYNIVWGALALRAEEDCKYSFGINIRRADGETVHHNGGCHTNEILNHFRATGRAKIEVINSSDPSRVGKVDNLDYYSINPPRGFNGWGYRTLPVYLSGDELKITVDDGFGTVLQRHFTLDVTPVGGFALSNSSSEPNSCSPHLRIKTSFSNSEIKKLPSLLPDGGTVPITGYQWANAYTKSNWILGKFKYEVEKEISAGTFSKVTHTEIDYNLIDVTRHGTGTYLVRVVSGAGCPVREQIIRNVNYLSTNRFEKAFNSIQKNRGIYEGTASFRMPIPSDFYYVHPSDPPGTASKAKLTITRVDGQTSMSFPTSLFFEEPVNKTINFPIEIPLISETINSNGVNFVGLGDFPLGKYIFKLEDACGSDQKEIEFTEVMSFGSGNNRPSYKVIKQCDTNEITYTLGNVAPNRRWIHVYLQRKNARGNWDTVDIQNFSSNGTFNNVEAGTYRLETRNYYYPTITTPVTPLEYMWTLLPPFANFPLTGLKTPNNPYILQEARGYSPNIEIEPRSFQPYVSTISCGTTDGSGMVLIDLSLSDLADEDITYTLYKEETNGTKTSIKSETLSPTVKTHSFQNLNNGKYIVEIKNSCFDYTSQLVEVDSDAVFQLGVDASQNICPGDMATMEVNVSPALFDIEWFRINPNTGAKEGPLGIGQKILTEAVHTQTTYEVTVKLKNHFGCNSNSGSTQTATITIIDDRDAPQIVTFPDNQTHIIPAGLCAVSNITWQEPTYTDICPNTVTVASTHTQPLELTVGVHSVVYTFTDALGNTASRTLVITINEPELESSLTDKYTDGGANELTELTADQLFYYEVSYQNIGQEIISKAELTVQLPNNSNVEPSTAHSVDVSVAGTGTTFVYDSANKSYTFTIPNYPAMGGKVRIPLQLTGGQEEAGKPCMNLLEFTSVIKYEGGGVACLRNDTRTVSSTIEINTSEYRKEAIFCTETPLEAQAGFTGYQWFRGNTKLVGKTKRTYTPNASDTYTVEKYILCGTKTVTSFEIFDFKTPVEIRDITVIRDKVNCVDKGQLRIDTTVEGLAPYRYMARLSTEPFPTEADFTTPSSTDVVTNFGDNILDLPVGTYKVYVLDSKGCIKEYTQRTFTISQALQPSIDNIEVDVCNPSNGKNNVNVNITFGEPTLTHYYVLDGANPVQINVTPFTIPELSPGIHTITVLDSDNCGDTRTITVNAPVTLGVASVTRELSCKNPTAAQITLADISGGTGIYTYELVQVIDRANNSYVTVSTSTVTIPSNTSTSVTVDVSSVGEYEFRVRDSQMASCTTPKISNPVIVEAAKLPEIDAQQTKITSESCYKQSEGSIELVAISATLEPIDFKIIQMKDLTTGIVTPTVITPASSSANTAKFTNLSGTITGIEYTIELTGNNGCKQQIREVVKSNPSVLANNALSTTQLSCATNSNLEAVISFDVNQISGGVPPYTWEFFNKTTGTSIGGNNQSTISVTDINGGTFYVEVRDSAGCATNTNEVTINPSFSLSNVVATVANPVTCLVNERISVNVTATPNYVSGTELRFTAKRLSDNFTVSETYSSTTATNSVNYTFTSLLPTGDYEITVENLATNCSVKGTHQVGDLTDKFEISKSNERQPSCYQGNDGRITLTFVDKKPNVGGNKATEGFTYTITHQTTNQVVTGVVPVGESVLEVLNLAGGDYRIDAISKANGCSVGTLFTIPQAASEIVVKATPVTPQVSCETNKGDISVEIVSGGKAPYVVTLSSATENVTQTIQDNSIVFQGLSAGIYTIALTDGWGCSTYTGTQTVELKAPEAVVASVTTTNVSCNGQNDGRIVVTNVSGGSGSNIFTYELESGTEPKITQASNIFENLKAGAYVVTVVDNMGCKTVTNTTITEPTLIETKIDVTASDRIVCYGDSDGYVKIKAKGGTQPYSIDIYTKESNSRVTPVSYVTPTPPNPALASEVEITTDPILQSGVYYAKVTDATGCSVVTSEFTIEEFPDIQPKEVYQDKTCNSNGLYDPIAIRFASPVDANNTFYILNGTRGSFSRVEGNYGFIDNYDRMVATQTLTIEYVKSHSDGQQLGKCTSAVSTLTVEEIKALTATEVINNGLNTIEVKAEGGVAPYRYSFNNEDQGDNPVYIVKESDPKYIDPITNEVSREISVEVMDDLGCTYTFTIRKVFYNIVMPNFFTPDGDGINDRWKPKNIENYPKSRTYIFDRNGRIMTILTPVDSWDGMYEGKHMPSGDYWYILELNKAKDNRKFYGNFTLYR